MLLLNAPPQAPTQRLVLAATIPLPPHQTSISGGQLQQMLRLMAIMARVTALHLQVVPVALLMRITRIGFPQSLLMAKCTTTTGEASYGHRRHDSVDCCMP